jgi:hypothetical protein
MERLPDNSLPYVIVGVVGFGLTVFELWRTYDVTLGKYWLHSAALLLFVANVITPELIYIFQRPLFGDDDFKAAIIIGFFFPWLIRTSITIDGKSPTVIPIGGIYFSFRSKCYQVLTREVNASNERLVHRLESVNSFIADRNIISECAQRASDSIELLHQDKALQEGYRSEYNEIMRVTSERDRLSSIVSLWTRVSSRKTVNSFISGEELQIGFDLADKIKQLINNNQKLLDTEISHSISFGVSGQLRIIRRWWLRKKMSDINRKLKSRSISDDDAISQKIELWFRIADYRLIHAALTRLGVR